MELDFSCWEPYHPVALIPDCPEVPMQDSSALVERRLERLSATFSISLLLSRENHSTEFEAYTVDISHRGLRVRTNFVLFPGDLIGIAPGTEAEQGIASRVVWAQRSSLGGSVAGLEFLEKFPN
jgi:hypothetical protein